MRVHAARGEPAGAVNGGSWLLYCGAAAATVCGRAWTDGGARMRSTHLSACRVDGSANSSPLRMNAWRAVGQRVGGEGTVADLSCLHSS